MRIYCTVFDKNYLLQGIALYKSLLKYSKLFRFYILCLDDVTYQILLKLNFGEIILVRLSDLMTEEIASIKVKTTYGQFCWVCQPLICQYILLNLNESEVTYLEADSIFFNDIEPLFSEIGNNSVSLVPHNFSDGFNNAKNAGIYCVQFNYFRNDHFALRVLDYWRDNCFKYSKNNLTSYPGQTCLDQWPHLFTNVKVINNIGAGVAPWNIQGKKITLRNESILINDSPIIFYHFHQYGRLPNGSHELGNYPIFSDALNLIYKNYINKIRDIESYIINNIDKNFNFKRVYNIINNGKINYNIFNLKNLISNLNIIIKIIRRRYNIYSDSFFD